MSLRTFSKFYYGHTIDDTNQMLDFDEGGSELTAELDIGEYTLTEFAEEVQRALNEAGALTYTVSVNRTTRIITIAASGNFTLLVTTGTNIGNAPWSLLGYTSNKTGDDEYAADAVSGSVYTPQFILQSYIPPEDNRVALQSTVSESANGNQEVVRFGLLQMVEMDIRFCTNITQPSNGPITNNGTGLEDVRLFLDYLITKAPVEFMPNSSDPATFYKVLLDSTRADKKGCGYKLKERYDRSMPGYYDTELLTFRVLE